MKKIHCNCSTGGKATLGKSYQVSRADLRLIVPVRNLEICPDEIGIKYV